ncbi:hypothetical protein C5S53_16110 [Methanophagales archaeon]|nr:hypothetical protein C5S53_16110 [Methanophagales archaeon]
MKMSGSVFAVFITVVLLMALTMNFVSAGSPAKASVTPVDQKEELKPSGPYKEKLNPSEPMAFTDERALNELLYDDGVAENAYYMFDADNGFAVRFTPPSYPAEITTAKICFWPNGTHEEFAVYVYDDDGLDGQPGTCLGGPICHTATEGGWCYVDLLGLDISITSGDFYILYQQLLDGPDCEALCYDESPPSHGRSWDYNGTLEKWYIWEYENYMIRCVVDIPTVESSWTFMVYLDADNSLEEAGIDDFMELSSVGSNSDVNIVAQFDRIPGYDSSYDDWTTCKRFLITSGMTPTAANAIEDLGECNMGDPNTLADFVSWTTNYFPADNYALILWNHGSGWKTWVPWAGDETHDGTEIGRGVCYDDTSGGDYLTLQETKQALTGKYVDLLGYDACFMHMVEVVYQVDANAGISVGSEDSEPNDGWPYDTILADLNATPAMTPRTLGAVIVQRYIESYGPIGSETQSAVDYGNFSGLVTAVDNLAEALIAEINAGNLTQIQQARSETVQIHYDYYIDLYHFAQNIETDVPGATADAQAVMDSVDIAVYAEAHGSGAPDEHGLSIYFPLEGVDYLASYDSTAFAIDTQWDEFLMEYYASPICGDMTVNPTSWNTTIICGNSANRTVGVSASGGIVEGVTVSKVVGPTWLNLYTTGLGDIASGSCKTFTMDAAPPSDTSGDFPYTIRVTNTCGTPTSAYVNGTITVLCDDLRVRLAVTCDSGTDVAEFGLNGNATDGFDPEFDMPEPPAPPSPYQQAYFYYPGNQLVKKLSTSYIPKHFIGSVEWNSWPFQLDYSGDSSEVTITWNAEDIAAVPTNYSLLFVVNGEQIDMRTTPSYTFNATTGTYKYEIIAMTAGQYTFELFTGWNMISFPVEPLDNNADTIFGPEYYSLYAWDPDTRTYVLVEEVETNVGYWLFVLEDRNVTVIGTPRYDYYTNLIGGWNMIGSIWTRTNVPLGTVTKPSGQMYPYLYTWNVDHYEFTQDIDPGEGYWALAYSNCSLHMFPTPLLAPISATPTESQLSQQIPRDLFDVPVPPSPP